MKKLQSLISLFTILSLLTFPVVPAFAQIDTTPPADMTATESTPEPEPVMETVAPGDTTPPVISDVSSMSLGLSETTISWSTDELATSKVRYGKTSALGQTAVIEGSGTLTHATTLMDLESGTTYHYCIDATDNAGNTAASCGHTFVTEAEPVPADTMPPTVLEVTVTNITTDAATIEWKTDEVSSGYVEYGTTADYGSVTVFGTALSTDHSQALSGLSPDTEYHYRVIATDEAGNETVTSDNTFTTEPPPVEPAPEPTTTEATSTSSTSTEPTAPTSGITTEMETTAPAATTTEPTAEALVFHSITPEDITHTSVTIRWETNLPADSLIEYGETADLGQVSAHHTALTAVHEVTIIGLTENTRYYFRAVSKPSDAATASMSSLHEFTTLASPIIVDPAANITSVNVSNITETSATITATTSELTRGSVEYGTTTAYEKSTTVSASSLSHTVTLIELAPGTKYHYRVKVVDAGGNETYSLDRTFTAAASTARASESGSTQTISDVTTREESVSPVPTPVVVGGGGVYVAPPGIPLLTTAASLDSEIVFMWNNPKTAGFLGVKLVRKEGGYPTSPTDGQTLYHGRSETFTDTGLANDQKFYYALYAYNAYRQYSTPLRISLAPKAGIEEVKVEKVPVLETTAPVEHFGAHLEFGDRGEEVIHLQQLLNVENVHESKLTTGYFGPLTRTSIKKFQDKHGLPQTGMADAATRAKLTIISAGHIVIGAPGAIVALDADLKRGDKGEDVGYLQEFLAYEGSYPDAIVNQSFGPLTQKGVIAFQGQYGVTPSIGYVGPKTRHTIQHALGL